MSKTPSTTRIGAFIFAGLVLLLSGTLLLSSGNWFRPKSNFIMFFHASLKGLDVGAPVKFNGVKVGVVTGISVAYNTHERSVYTPVTMQINSSMFDEIHRPDEKIVDYDVFFQEQIEIGLAAKLTMDSVLTGKFFIELNYFAKEDLREVKNFNSKYQQMPTVFHDFSEIISNIDEVVHKINTINFQGVFDSINNAGNYVATIFADPNLREIVRSLNLTISNFNNLTVNANNTLTNISDDLKTALKSFSKSMESLYDTSEIFQDMLGDDTDFRTGLDVSITEMAKAFRTMHLFLDYLERNPNALLTGKGAE